MNSIYLEELEELEEFEILTGTTLGDELCPTSASIPAELFNVVSKAKISQASVQQMKFSIRRQCQ